MFATAPGLSTGRPAPLKFGVANAAGPACGGSMSQNPLSLLASLTEAHGAPGHEDAVRAIFRAQVSALGAVTCDRLGSIMCEVRGGSGPRVMVTAHMDEVGFMVHSITERGFLQVVPLGGWWTHTLPAQRLRIRTRSGRDVLGVVAATPPHHLPDSDRNRLLPIEHLFIDIGATERRHAEEGLGVRVGDPVVPDTVFTRMSNDKLLCAKAFDNRVGVGVVIETLHQIAAGGVNTNQLLGVATVQEEIGCRGALTAAALARPDVALVIEGTPADDTPGIPNSARQAVLGGGPQIRVMDPTSLMNPRLVTLVRDLATEKGIPHQCAVRRNGGTDARSFHTSGIGVACVVIGVPARYIHSHNSIIHTDDYFATITLVTELVRRLDAEAVAGLTAFDD
jgi:endoglucanase